MYGLFHWGPLAWALYCIPALPIAYAFHNRKIPFLRISQACRGVIGDRADGPLGKLIDVLFIFGLDRRHRDLARSRDADSLGVHQHPDRDRADLRPRCVRDRRLDGDLRHHRLPGDGEGHQAARRRQRLSRVLPPRVCPVFGPTVFILDTFTNSLGLLATNFVQNEPVHRPGGRIGFPQTWTVFYWAWWIAYAPFMGLFVARISRGRTIREVVAANLVWGSLGCWLFFATFGNTALHDQLNGKVPVIEIMNEVSPQAAIVAVVKALPHGYLHSGSLRRHVLHLLGDDAPGLGLHHRVGGLQGAGGGRVGARCAGTGSSGRWRSAGWRWH